MSDPEQAFDWRRTQFDGSRREQLRRAQAMSVRERLEALDQLTQLSDRMQAMPRQRGAAVADHAYPGVQESPADYRADHVVHEIVLDGCTPTPLANYLKALGVLRLLSVKYPETRGSWRGDKFVLRTPLDRSSIECFFLYEYEPTPIMAPWNGGSGFYYQERKSKEKDPITGKKRKLGIFDQETAATKVVDAMLTSTNKRLGAYKEAIGQAKRLVQEAGFVTSPSGGKEKDDFILSLRSRLSDACIQAMDAGLAVTAEKTQYPPLLGTGWNDGNLDFASNFMQRLLEVLGTTDEALPNRSDDWLSASLFGTSSPNLTRRNIGQFFPGQAGGPNAGIGFDADAAINPWDFVLMIEGALMFAAAAVRRNADDLPGAFSYPFTVRAVVAGSGSLGEGDSANSRGELWMPLWSQPASFSEIRSVMAEGRVALGKRPARDALDFVRAVHRFGSYRGVRSFQRFGLLMRFGKAYLATPLSRVEVIDEAASNLLDELDKRSWLDRFRRFARGDNTANRFQMLRHQLEDQLFDLSGQEPTPAETQSLLVLLGEIHKTMTASRKAKESVPPLPRLSEQWVTAADDGTPAFRIAKALAGLRGVGDEPLPLRAQLFPVHRRFDQWMTPDAGENVRIHIGQRGRVVDTLRALLTHRLQVARRLEFSDKPLESAAGAMLDDVAAFLHGDSMDGRIAALLPGLCLCRIPEDIDHAAGEGVLPAAFSLMKLALTPDKTLRSLGHLRESDHIPIPAGMLAKLDAGNHENRAVVAAWRRLHASGLTPIFRDPIPTLSRRIRVRAPAALLIPLRYGATGALARGLLEQPVTPSGSGSDRLTQGEIE
jgi:CRISPR-associated protein Csx17